MREKLEPVLGDLRHVRVHEDAMARETARELGAKAFAFQNHVFIGPRQSPDDLALMAHESTHVVQQSGPSVVPSVQRQEDEEDTDSADSLVADESDDLGLLEADRRHFAVRLCSSDSDAELFLVPSSALRADIAARLFGDENAVAQFDVVPAPPASGASSSPDGQDLVAVRARTSTALTVEAATALRVSLDGALDRDVNWTVSKLSERRIDDADERALAERALRWSQRSELSDASGTSYFDRYLGALSSRHLVQSDWYTAGVTTTTRTALSWLLEESSDRSEQIRKAIQLRSRRWTAGYVVTDSRPELVPGDVIGRYYWSDGGTIQVLTRTTLVRESSLQRAEVATRNAPWTGMKAVVPGGDGRYYGYALSFPQILGGTHPASDPGGRYYWYHPGTVFIRGGEYRSDIVEGSQAEQAHRRELANQALSQATADNPSSIMGLDYDVLSVLDIQERLRVFRIVFDGRALESAAGAALLSRLILSTPDGDFRQLGRSLLTAGSIQRLIASNAETKFMVGQAFTAKALAVFPVNLGALEALPSFRIGTEGETRHMIDVPTRQASTELVEGDQWDPEQGVSLASEPAGAEETAGTVNRTALAFTPVRHETQLRYLSTHTVDATSRSFHPFELVRLDIVGPQADTRVLTAIELACIASVPNFDLLAHGMSRVVEAWAWYGAARGLGRGFGPAFSRGLASGGWSGALRALAATATTQGGRTALRQFAMQSVILSSFAVVDSYRNELRRTEEGRAFLAVYDVGMLMLAGHGIYRLASSGALRTIATRGVALMRAAGSSLRTSVVEGLESIRAFDIAWQRMRAARQLVAETNAGVRNMVPANESTFRHYYFAARAELAADRTLASLRGAALPTGPAQSILQRFQALAEGSEEIARGYSAVVRRAAAMPAAQIDAYLGAVDALRAARPSASSALAEFMRASAAARITNPVALLADAQWLASTAQVTDEALTILARKVRTGSLDLAWLRRTALAAEEINFLGLDNQTPWRLFQRASEDPTNWLLQNQARTRLRGLAGEYVTNERAAELFPHHRLVGRQVRMGGSIIDFELMARDGTGVRHALEVKGWDPDKWREALNAWIARQREIRAARAANRSLVVSTPSETGTVATALSEEQMRLVRQLEGVLVQLNDAAAARGGAPYLVVTDRLSGPTHEKLVEFLRANAPRTLIEHIPEVRILEITRRWRAALGLPEPAARGTAASGTPSP